MISRQTPLAWLVFAALLYATTGAWADDRELLRARGSEPYVFILFDTSRSMNASPVCDGLAACEDIDPYDRSCTALCPLGNPFDVADPRCSQVCPDWGCVRFGSADAAPAIEETLDDPMAVYVPGGSFAPASPSGALMGNAMVGVDTATVGETATFAFAPSPETRRYKLFLHVPRSDQWANRVPVQVSGTVHAETVLLNQRTPVTPPGEEEEVYNPWFLVGVYEVQAGASLSAQIRLDGSNGTVVVDGARILSEVKVCEQMGYRCQTPICPTGDCFLGRAGDDPGSKFFQAKQALYETLDEVSTIRLGFATYEQDRLQALGKHWLYRVREDQPGGSPQQFIALPGGGVYPQPGALEVFGVLSEETTNDPSLAGLWECKVVNTGNAAEDNLRKLGCNQPNPASLDDGWERERLRRIPKLGQAKTQQTIVYAQPTSTSGPIDRLRITYKVGGDPYGSATMAVNLSVETCRTAFGTNCFFWNAPQNATIYYDLVSDYVGQDVGFSGSPLPVIQAYGFINGLDANAEMTCGHPLDPSMPAPTDPHTGWDPNDDSGDPTMPNLRPVDGGDGTLDQAVNANLRWPTIADPLGRSSAANSNAFDVGDVIPWDWTAGTDHIRDVQDRLAPNRVSTPNELPDFRIATYLADQVDPADFDKLPNRQIRLKNTAERPLIAVGATPLGRSTQSFLDWYEIFSGEAGNQNGTIDDPDWECRDRFLVVLTDGDDTCGGINPCDVTSTLLDPHEVKTFVVGFGLQDEGNFLGCMAANGGTDKPILPRNKDELVSALLDIFGEVQSTSRTFASASLPTVQSTASDKIVFSSFAPVPNRSMWPGRIDVFREPLLAEEVPSQCGRRCREDGLEASCHLWNAGDTILGQAPTDSQIMTDPPDGNLGTGVNQRRVLYPPAFRPLSPDGTMAQPIPLRLFELPDFTQATPPPEIEDWKEVFVRPSQQRTLSDDAVEAQLTDIYRATLGVKNTPDIADPCGDGVIPFGVNTADYQPGDYLMGDVFHATPAVPSGPSDLRFLRRNLCGTIGATEPNNCRAYTAGQGDLANELSYRNFVRRSFWLRRMLTAATNDGQLHFFDLGTRTVIDSNAVFTDGSGVELFSYMPRMVMPIVREQALGDRQIFSLDGPFVVGEVVIDPKFNDFPHADEREWRTVLIGGLREGGDRFDSVRPVDGFVSGYYALDITQPDGLQADDPNNTPTDIFDDEYIPINTDIVPSCLRIDGTTKMLVDPVGAACESAGGEKMPFPALKWEFTDRLFFTDTNPTDADGDTSGWFLLDEDRNGEHDLANTWSRPLIAQVQITGNTTRWVAIFGGGVDPTDVAGTRTGNWLFMVDIETGAILYKREVDGAVPGDITGLDENRDGILDFLYFGTTAGFLYKVDLRVPAPVVADVVETDQIIAWPGQQDVPVERIDLTSWIPFKIFDTEGKPLYFPPAIVLISETEQTALAFGTGDRENLWSETGVAGRFYVILDQDFTETTVTPSLPLTETDFFTLDFDSPLVGVDGSGNPLLNPPNFLLDDNLMTFNGSSAEPGWIMRFPVDARSSNRAFVLSGVLVFTIFQPDEVPLSQGDQNLCQRGGLSRTFVVDVRNGDALTILANLRDDSLADDRGLIGGTGGAHNPNPASNPPLGGDCGDRCSEAPSFGTAPFVSSLATRNPPISGGSPGPDPLADPVMKRLLGQMKRSFFPPGCKFNDSFVQMIRMQFDNQEVQNLVPVPIGLCPSDATSRTPEWSED